MTRRSISRTKVKKLSEPQPKLDIRFATVGRKPHNYIVWVFEGMFTLTEITLLSIDFAMWNFSMLNWIWYLKNISRFIHLEKNKKVYSSSDGVCIIRNLPQKKKGMVTDAAYSYGDSILVDALNAFFECTQYNTEGEKL